MKFWTNKGYSIDQAKEIISQLQNRNKDYFVQRYGSLDGTMRFDRMIEKRNKTWFSKDEEARSLINASKGKTFKYLSETYGEEKAQSIIISRTSGVCCISNKSKEFFKELDLQLGVYAGKSITGYRNTERWIKTSSGIKFVDYYVEGLIIEYFGSFWHANPEIYQENDIHPVMQRPCSEIWNIDSERIKEFEKLGHKVLIVWEHCVKLNKDLEIQRAKNFIIENLKNNETH